MQRIQGIQLCLLGYIFYTGWHSETCVGVEMMRRKLGGTWETDSIGNQTDKEGCLDKRDSEQSEKDGQDGHLRPW